MKLALMLLLLVGCATKPDVMIKWDSEIEEAVLEWREYNRLRDPVDEHLAAVEQARERYEAKPSADTAGEVLSLIHLFTTEPVP